MGRICGDAEVEPACISGADIAARSFWGSICDHDEPGMCGYADTAVVPIWFGIASPYD